MVTGECCFQELFANLACCSRDGRGRRMGYSHECQHNISINHYITQAFVATNYESYHDDDDNICMMVRWFNIDKGKKYDYKERRTKISVQDLLQCSKVINVLPKRVVSKKNRVPCRNIVTTDKT